MFDLQVEGKRIVVVGAARSGMAAATLLARRGARVTLADLKPELPEASALAAQGVDLALGPHDPTTVRVGRPDRAQPGRAAAPAGPDAGPPREGADHRRDRAGVPPAARPDHRDHRHEGEVHDDDAGRPDARGGGAAGVRGREHRRPACRRRWTRRPDETIHVVEVSSFQLETTETFHPWIAALLNLSADHLDRHANLREYAAGEGAGVREPGRGRLGGRQRGRRAGDAPRGAEGGDAPMLLFSLDQPLERGDGARRTAGSCRALPGGPTCRCCR